MPMARILTVIAVSVVASTSFAQDKQRLVDEQLRYLGHLHKAEAHLEDSDPDAAIAELTHAFTCDVRDSHVPRMQLETQHAVAHYLRSCALAMKQDTSGALDSLRDAARNGFRNTRMVKSDPLLAAVREAKEFGDVLLLFPSERFTDAYAGKMVVNRDFGIGLQMHRKGNFPKLGESAPDFELGLLGEEKKTLRLSDYRDHTPVVLIFGSFT
jgi:hypothetical protein